MAVLAANITNDTVDLINRTLASPDFVKFALQNKLNLSDRTILIRLALINLKKHIPSNEEVMKYKAALLRPQEFDSFWSQELGSETN